MTAKDGFAFDHALLQLGVFLFLLGLLTGFAVPALTALRQLGSQKLVEPDLTVSLRSARGRAGRSRAPSDPDAKRGPDDPVH